MTQTPTRWLLADIGGTNSRVALYERGRMLSVCKLRNARFDDIEAMLAEAIRQLPNPAPSGGVLAIAGPCLGDDLSLSNLDWAFNRPTLQAHLSLDRLHVINDFEALAYCVPLLGSTDYRQVGNGKSIDGAPCVLIGPGTGLGVASLIQVDGRAIALPGEGGHVTLPAHTEAEEAIIDRLRARHGHCSAERVLSGDGLEKLHFAMFGEAQTAAQISEDAQRGDTDARETFLQFFDFLATVAGDAALTLGAVGGLYIGGGIVPANLELFETSSFRERFIDKGRFRAYLDAIPTRIITTDTPALTGLAGYVDALPS
ncbi:MAG: glucokinase [Pseudomonadota bacterium]